MERHHDRKSAVNLSAFSRLSPLSSVSVWQKMVWRSQILPRTNEGVASPVWLGKSDRLYSELRNERSLELKFLLC